MDMSAQKRSVVSVHLFVHIKVIYKATLTNSTLLPDSVGIFHIAKRNSISPLDMRKQSTLPRTQKQLPVKIMKKRKKICLDHCSPASTGQE